MLLSQCYNKLSKYLPYCFHKIVGYSKNQWHLPKFDKYLRIELISRIGVPTSMNTKLQYHSEGKPKIWKLKNFMKRRILGGNMINGLFALEVVLMDDYWVWFRREGGDLARPDTYLQGRLRVINNSGITIR